MNDNKKTLRSASHAGTWYTASSDMLDLELEENLNQVVTYDDEPPKNVRAIVSPHAGYRFSGKTAAYAYRQMNKENISRIFIFGPSHHQALRGCALSSFGAYQTPFGNLNLDQQIIQTLFETGHFHMMNLEVDQAEHSIEMQIPFVAKIMKGKCFKIVPILVGTTSSEEDEIYGRVFATYFQDSTNFFIISSDFCHWGKRFHYQPYDSTKGEISQYIEWLDRMGIELLENLDMKGFKQYLNTFQNTICGRHPILVFLQTIQASGISSCALKFTHYTQSHSCKTMKDSSVSYAAAIVYT